MSLVPSGTELSPSREKEPTKELADCGNSSMGQWRLNDRHQGPGGKQERPLWYSIYDQVEILSQMIQST